MTELAIDKTRWKRVEEFVELGYPRMKKVVCLNKFWSGPVFRHEQSDLPNGMVFLPF